MGAKKHRHRPLDGLFMFFSEHGLAGAKFDSNPLPLNIEKVFVMSYIKKLFALFLYRFGARVFKDYKGRSIA